MTQTEWRFCGNRSSVKKLRLVAQRHAPRHALILSGIPSVGKKSLVLRFAQSLLCPEAKDGIPCFECSVCRRIIRGSHPDVSIFSLEQQSLRAGDRAAKASSLTIETARLIASEAPLRPMSGDWRIVVIDDAESMQKDAQEALLKTIEEPPGFLVLILLTTDLEALLPTIRSRCELVELGPVPTAEIEDFLREGGTNASLALQASSLSAGAPGWAIQAIADPTLFDARKTVVDRAAAWIQEKPFQRIAVAFTLSDSMTRNRPDVYGLLEATATLWRDALLVRTGNSDRIVIRAQAELSNQLAGSLEIFALQSALSSVWTCIADLQINVRPRLALETMVLSWPSMPTHN